MAEHLGPAAGPALVGLGVVVLVTPLTIWLAPRLGFVSVPTRERDIHRAPVPRLGGLALYAAFAAAAFIFTHHDLQHTALLGLGGLTVLVFLVDDRRGLPAAAKLAVNLALALVAVLAFDFRINFLNLPGLHVVDLGLMVVPVTLFWIVGMQNTVNLLDGVDGLAAGVVGIVALTLMVAAAGRARQPDVVMLAGGLAGACAGFLLFNFHPARVFMGDSGSQFLGLALALLSVMGVAKVAVASALVVPVLALAVPIADTAMAIVRRRRERVSIAHADTRHIHHQLLDFGLNQAQTCLLLYGATAILGAVALTLFFGHRRILSVAIVFIIVAISTVLGERLQVSERQLKVPGLRLLLEGRGLG